MEESLFSRIFRYRETPEKATIENFLSEILAYSIETDELFRSKFFNEVLQIDYNKEEVKIRTQEIYDGFGIPDIEINYHDTVILFECKVDQKEGSNQLDRYSSILIKLKQNIRNKHLVYLTKYYDQKEVDISDLYFHQIRWYSIFELIDNDYKEITKALKSFLKDLGMEKVKNFNIQDLLALQIIPLTLSKMDELIDSVKDQFTKHFGVLSKDSSRSTRLIDSFYSNFVTLKYEGSEYWLDVGFYWWDEEEEIPKLCIMVEYPKKKFDHPEFIEILKKELVENLNWEQDEGDYRYFILKKRPLTDFIGQDLDSIPAMKNFILEQLGILIQIQTKYPKMFKK